MQFIGRNAFEILFTFMIACGAKWGPVFVSPEDWNKDIEQVVDFVLICLSWLLSPVVFISGYMKCRMPHADIVISVVLCIMIAAVLVLLTKKRVDFFNSHWTLIYPARFMPPMFLVGKILLEF